ncbi:hypothetical protein BCV70DRAFT_27210 [Testicularia cyperi]|uniref:Secreted protein n=1 Tax=Testicularia cyperi TaxID=1882483 RepID=A0A317XN14_9BASI|nr:hypothetical protein BCV70DRAFT_27210 [Testicularia cyperi]
MCATSSRNFDCLIFFFVRCFTLRVQFPPSWIGVLRHNLPSKSTEAAGQSNRCCHFAHYRQEPLGRKYCGVSSLYQQKSGSSRRFRHPTSDVGPIKVMNKGVLSACVPLSTSVADLDHHLRSSAIQPGKIRPFLDLARRSASKRSISTLIAPVQIRLGRKLSGF